MPRPGELVGYDDWKTTDPKDYDHCPECLQHHHDCQCPVPIGPEDAGVDPDPDVYVPEYFDGR